MTELIVALDGPNTYRLRTLLYARAGVRWFKLGPQAMTDPNWASLLWSKEGKTFLDLKLADTNDTVREAIKRFADFGISAVSTYTSQAATTALAAAHNTELEIWQVVRLTDAAPGNENNISAGSGVICPGEDAGFWKINYKSKVIVPGVRLYNTDNFHGHQRRCICQEIVGLANYAVVGRPIWQSEDPVAAAKRYMEAFNHSL